MGIPQPSLPNQFAQDIFGFSSLMETVQVGFLIEEQLVMLALDELCKLVHDNIQEAVATDKIIQAQPTAKLRCNSKDHSPNGWSKS